MVVQREKEASPFNGALLSDGTVPLVAVVGSGPTGSIIAKTLAGEHGIETLLFEQTDRAGGVTNNGFSPWSGAHKFLPIMEQDIATPGVRFLPNTRFDEQTDILALTGGRPLSAIIFATGTQRERQLDLPGLNEYEGKGFIRHNAFRYLFNGHAKSGESWDYFPEKLFDAATIERLKKEHWQEGKTEEAGREQLISFVDGAVIFGGGRATLEVAKALVSLTISLQLQHVRGVNRDPIEIAKTGPRNVLAEYTYSSLADIGLSGPTIVTRRGIEHMRMLAVPSDSTPEQKERFARINQGVIKRAQEDCFIKVRPWSVPIGLSTQNNMISAVTISQSAFTQDGGQSMQANTETIPTRLIIPAIGSEPEQRLFSTKDIPPERTGVVGSAGEVIGNFRSIRRQAKKTAREIAARVLAL